MIGRIVRFGPGAKHKDYTGHSLKVGDRITWLLYSYDSSDPLSKKGYPQKSSNMFKYGHELITNNDALHSGFAEYIILRKGTCIFKIPKKISPHEAAPLNCGIATAIASIRIAEPKIDASFAILGCGLLGLYTIAILNSRGVKKITAIDVNEDRLEMARELVDSGSYEFTLNSENKFDYIFEMSGSQSAMGFATKALDIGGTLILAGATYPQPNLDITGEFIVRNILSIKGIHNYHPYDLSQAIRFLKENRDTYPLRRLVEQTYPLYKINEAFEYAFKYQPIRIAIKPHAEV
jgi:threonine dehydrogenase-like Zn-dependent dehydrogenase